MPDDTTATGTTLLGYSVTLWAALYCVDRADAELCAAQMRARCSVPGAQVYVRPIVHTAPPEAAV